MKMLSNQKGSSLVQVMVISGMVSVFGLAVMQTSKNMQSMKQTLIIKDSIEQFKETASNLLMNETACANTLAALIPSRSSASSDKTFSTIRDYDNASAYRQYDETDISTVYHGNIRIGGMRLTGFDDTTDSAKLEVTVLKSKTEGVGAKFGQLVLGGKAVAFEIPIRVYFTRPPGVVTDSPSDIFESCFADNAAFDAAEEAPLKKLCDNDLGGSFYNGRCIVTEHIMNQARCDGDLYSCSGDANNPDSYNSICHSLGGVYNSDDGSCDPRFGNVECSPGTKLIGFTDDGHIRCEVP